MVVNALGSQLMLAEGLQELSLVPPHLGVSGEVSPSPHAASPLGSCLCFWASCSALLSLEEKHRQCLSSCQVLNLTSEATTRGSSVPWNSETRCPYLLCCVGPLWCMRNKGWGEETL